MKRPNKCGDIWEDYKQIFLDFSLNNDCIIVDTFARKPQFRNSKSQSISIYIDDELVDHGNKRNIDFKMKKEMKGYMKQRNSGEVADRTATIL